MRVVFRVDASNRIGTGHVRRCRTLAEALRRRGAEVRFVCRAHPGHMLEDLGRAALPVTALSPPADEVGAGGGYAAWVGAPQATDAAETIAALDGTRPDWLVVDHYGLDIEWERALRPQVGRILAIDDLASRPHDCDLLLDQNHAAGPEDRYRDLVPETCRRLLGPRYALLQPEYATQAATMPARDGRVRRVLVFFGGVDSTNMAGMALEVLSTPPFAELEVDVVVGANSSHRRALAEQAQRRPRTTLHPPRPHLAELMAQADLALGAGGTTTWERLCLGLPTLVVSIAENQIPACETLTTDRLIRYAGDVSAMKPARLDAALRAMIDDTRALAAMSVQGKLQVDGLGTCRVAEAIMPTEPASLRLRPARAEDAALYFGWANEPEVRRQSLNAAFIPWPDHEQWFAARLADPHCRLFVLEAGTLPVGQIRFDLSGDEARINYSLDPIVRGRRWAEQLVTRGVRLLQETTRIPLRAEVKEANQASSKVFLRLGFEERPSSSGGVRVFWAPCSRSKQSAEAKTATRFR